VRPVNGFNADITNEQRAKLRELFPEVFAEDKIDWDKLKVTLGESIESGERYGLSWKGKSGIFAKIQEKTVSTLHPQPEESINWDTTQNMFIEGDNLETLKVLHKAYYGKIKMIYIDPPYNTGSDLVYNDNFKKTRREQALDEGTVDAVGNVARDDGLQVNNSGHRHSKWLDMMYPRLFLARNFLRQDGVIFVSIDDNEIHNLRLIMNEIFGEENFVGEYIWHKKVTGGYDNENINMQHEYILVYARRYSGDLLNDEIRESSYKLVDEKGKKYKWDSLWNIGGLTYSASLDYPITAPDGTEIWPLGERGVAFWLWSKKKVEDERDKLKFEKGKDGQWRVYKRVYASEGIVSGSMLDKNIVKGNTYSSAEIKNLFDGKKLFDYAKPSTLMQYLVERGTSGDDIVMDFFAGSGSLAQGVMQANLADGASRRWIMVQLSELADAKSEAYKAGYKQLTDLARERVRRASQKISKEFADKISKRSTLFDLGFRSYVLGGSNFKKWNDSIADPTEIRQQMLEHIDSLEPNAQDADLLTEVLLKRGISPLTEIETHDDFVFIPSESLAISLARTVTEELFTQILAKSPAQMILLDQAFKNDANLKTNLVLQAEKQGIAIETL
jgi:adenine-specific DNA-methyltransferase